MDRKKPLIILGFALVTALLATVLIFNWLQDRSRALKAIELQTITVAAVDLSWATVISKEYLTTAQYPKKALPNGYYPDPAALEGRTLLYPVKANEPITESKLAPTTMKGGGIAAVVSPKKRAMAVKVDKVVGVSGFVHPGNRVDVLVTIDKNIREVIKEPMTKIVLENILVLAAGKEVDTGKQEKAQQVDVITLEVTPDEGEKLALAATEGKLQLALRNYSDNEPALTKGKTIPVLLGAIERSPVKQPGRKIVKKQSQKKTEVVLATKGPTVEFVRGNKMTQVKLEGGN